MKVYYDVGILTGLAPRLFFADYCLCITVSLRLLCRPRPLHGFTKRYTLPCKSIDLIKVIRPPTVSERNLLSGIGAGEGGVGHGEVGWVMGRWGGQGSDHNGARFVHKTLRLNDLCIYLASSWW